MKIKHITALSLAICSLSACDDIKTKLHLMQHQDEQQCLDSERLNFKDPDVLFVANLGDRGLGTVPDQYWVRYKAKNSYGAYLQGNMLCKKNAATGKWVKNDIEELLLTMKVKNALLENALVLLKQREIPRSQIRSSDGDLERDANEIIFTSANSLAEYADKKK